MSKPLKEDYIIRIKSRIEQHVKEPVEQEEKEEFMELMTRGQFVQKGGSYYITYKETETTGYEGCTTTLKIAVDGSRVVMLRFGKNGGVGTQLQIEKGKRNLCHYETGFGSMTLGVTADEIVNELTEKGGTVRFAYLLDANSADLVSRNRIQDLTVTRSLSQRIFGMGTILVNSSDKTLGDFEIKNIKNVMDVKEQLSALVEIQRDQKRVYTRENISGDSEADHDDYM